MIKRKKNYVLILVSGGIDSTACIEFYKKLKFDIEGIYIDHGQLANKNEYKSIRQISEYYKIKIKKVVLKNNKRLGKGVIIGRNAFFYFTALMNFRKPNGIIASGIHSGTNYYDCSKSFISNLQIMFDEYSQGTIKIGAPFLGFNKKEIFDYCEMEKVPLSLTYSCELGNKQPCGKCFTCKDLKAIYDSKEQQN